MTNNRRLPAEWESCFTSVMIARPHAATDWAPMLDEVTSCYDSLVAAIAEAGMEIIETGDNTNDTWTRDYGPITVEDGPDLRLFDFTFNGWGMKFAADKDNLVNSRLFAETVNRRGFVLEGGSIESDGRGTLMTTSRCLLSPNRNAQLGRDDIEEYLKAEFGLKQVLWVDHGFLEGDDTDSHIDTLARLAPHDTILYCGAGNETGAQHDSLVAMARQLRSFMTSDGRPFNLIELPLPDPIFDDEGERLPATYANYLATPKAILMPTYGQPRNDRLAADTLRIVYGDRRIITVDCRALIRQHGSLHCATMQLPEVKLKPQK